MARRHRLDPQIAWRKSLKWVAVMLDACRDQGIIGIISLNQIPIDPALGLTQNSPEFWNDAVHQAEAVSLAGKLAGNFSKRGIELGAYEVLSEPLILEGKRRRVPKPWPRLMENIVKKIREYDQDRWIVITPGPGGLAKGYRRFKPLDDEKIIYGAHVYTPHVYTHQGIGKRVKRYIYPGYIRGRFWDRKELSKSLADLRKFQIEYNTIVWIGEFSVVRWAPGSVQYLVDLVEIFNQYSWGWCYFNFKGYHGWNPDYDTVFATDKREDWSSHFAGEKSARWTTLKKVFRLDKDGTSD